MVMFNNNLASSRMQCRWTTTAAVLLILAVLSSIAPPCEAGNCDHPIPTFFYLTPDLIPWFIFLMLDWCCVAGIGGKCASPPFVPVRPKSLRCFTPGTRQECNIQGCATVCSRNGINTHWGYCDKSTWECCCPRWCTCLDAPAVRCKRDNKISEEQSILYW